MANHKSRVHSNIGLLLILLIGFGFGAFLFMQPESIENHQSDHGSSSAVESHEEHGEPGTEKVAHGTEEVAHGTEEVAPNNSPITLLSIFLGINVALILSAVILKKVRSKRKVLPRESAPTLEITGRTK